jgi:hypothetical protein
LGVDHRIGYVREGYDADLVLWDSHPLSLGATPIQVIIDGVALFDEKIVEKKLEREVENLAVPRQLEFDEVEALSPDDRAKELQQNNFVATGIKKAFIRGKDGLESISAMTEPFTMVVQNGEIVCLSSTCSHQVETARAQGVKIHHLQNGYILPGLTILAPSLGLAEILAEKSTYDGLANSDPAKPQTITYARDGLTFDGKHLERAHAAGILNIITAPLSTSFLQGVSVAFNSGAKSILEKGAIIQEEVALHFLISHGTRGPITPSISSQIGLLRQILINSANETETIYGRAANGKIPLAITTQNKDIIAHLINLKNTLEGIAPINLVIIGGIESYLLAEELSQAKIPVILAPWRCQPESWEYRHCLPGPPISEKTAFQILLEHGVDVVPGVWDDGLVSALYWEAAWAAKGTGLTEKEVVELISTKIERILGIEGNGAGEGGHVLFEGNPLDFGAKVAAIIA